MAGFGVFSLLNLNCRKPFSSPTSQTSCFNSLTSKRRTYFQNPNFRISPKTLRLLPNPCALDENSDQTSLQEGAETRSLGVKAALSMLKFYKREISPLLPKSCRYVPTCSEYSMQAYEKYGVVKGTVLTVWRLCRCNPLGGSGFDPPRWFDEPRPSEDDEDI